MAKYKIIKEFNFDAGHRLYSHDVLSGRGSRIGKLEKIGSWKRFRCGNLHGHTFYVKIVVEADKLDIENMVLDTEKIKIIIKEFMEKYDHSYIIDDNDPLKENFLNFFEKYRVVTINGDPTFERIAQEIYEFFNKRFKEIVPDEYLKEFRIREVILKGGTNIAIYFPYD